MFEDLLASKDQIDAEMSYREGKSLSINVELDSLRSDNSRLKGLCKRYKNLIEEVKGNKPVQNDKLSLLKRDFEIRKSSIGTTIYSELDGFDDQVKDLNRY